MKDRLYFVLEHKVRVSIIYLPLLCLVFSLWLSIRFPFFKVFKGFLAHCYLIKLLFTNFDLLYFQTSTYSVIYISFVFDLRSKAKRSALSLTHIFFSCITSQFVEMYCLLLSTFLIKLLQSRLFDVYWDLDDIGYM